MAGGERWSSALLRWVAIVIVADAVFAGAGVLIAWMARGASRESAGYGFIGAAIVVMCLWLVYWWGNVGMREVFSVPGARIVPDVDLERTVDRARWRGSFEITALGAIMTVTLGSAGLMLLQSVG